MNDYEFSACWGKCFLFPPRPPRWEDDTALRDDAGGREQDMGRSALVVARPGTEEHRGAERDTGTPGPVLLPARYGARCLAAGHRNRAIRTSRCRARYYCPEGGKTAVPCPRGTFGPSSWATDTRDCISCPPYHYAPREGLAACLPCGPRAQQPLPGQDKCVCLREGQVFQASDGQCHCALGYRATRMEDGCQLKVYELCKDGSVRDQRGKCLSSRQWERLCSLQVSAGRREQPCEGTLPGLHRGLLAPLPQVCASPERYEGYDASLGLCVCTDPAWHEPTRSMFLKQVLASGSVLLSVLKRWDSEGRLRCDGRLGFSRPVYVVQTDETGFFGLLHTVPTDVQMLVLDSSQEAHSTAEAPRTHGMAEFRGNHTHMDMNSHWSSGSASRGAMNGGVAGVMNPTACLRLDDILLFTVTTQHYPQYDTENLLNTNAAFDWGPFRLLAQELTMAPPAQSLFSISFSEPGVYALRLSSNHHKHMYVKVLPAGGECYDPGPFFPTHPRHMTRMGIARQRHLLLHPDWLVIGGLLAGAAALLCLCIVLLVLFKERGWPEKRPAQARYRILQLKYNMDDYSSKGSRVILQKKAHRSLQAGLTEESGQRAVMPDEFWDYEEQVDLEAFSSSTFYDILLKHSMSVTACLGQLRGEVKQLYQSVISKVQELRPAFGVATGSKTEDLERRVERETARRKTLGLQLTQLLDSQLQMLRTELQHRRAMHTAFSAALGECVRLLPLLDDSQAHLCDTRIQQPLEKKKKRRRREEKRGGEEERRREEEKKRGEERRRREEEKKRGEERRRREEEKKKGEERRRREEEKKKGEERRRREEKKRGEEERRREEEKRGTEACVKVSLLLPSSVPLPPPLSIKDRVVVLAEQMADLVSAEAQRQGAWALLKRGLGARLLCPVSGTPLSRDDLIAPDGTVRACEAVHTDPCTGLAVPDSNAHMLLASGHSMPVPPDFFLQPRTGRVLPVAGNVGFDPTSSTLVYTADACVDELGKWDSPLLPYVPYPQSHSAQIPGLSKLRGLRAGQRLVFGGPMCDYDTGVLVPILAVTIHPQTGMVYPLGGVHVCPVSQLQLPIQIGCPMLDSRTGSMVLITGVTLDPQSGVVLPVGGLLLGDTFIEPLSGRQARVGGSSLRGGKVVPHAGGFQALLDCQALGARMRLAEQVWRYCTGRNPETLEGCSWESRSREATLEMEQAWRASQRSTLHLLSRMEAQREWAWRVAQDGGSVGELKLPCSELSLPALPGLEYPDPGGSGISVPVLGAQLDWVSGCLVPLAGTMEDPDGKGQPWSDSVCPPKGTAESASLLGACCLPGLVPIRLGAQTVDPVTAVLVSVVGARLDVWKRTVVPVTTSQCVTIGESPDCVLEEALQEECSVRRQFWRDQGEREEELVGDLDRALISCLRTDHLVWTDMERQLKEAVTEIQEAADTEAHRRSFQSSELSLLLSTHVLLTLTRGDEEEWENQKRWHAELTAMLNRVSVSMAQWQWKQDQPTPLGEEPDVSGSQRALWELVRQSLSDLDAGLASVRCARDLSQLSADTAQAVLSGSSWYRDYGLAQPQGEEPVERNGPDSAQSPSTAGASGSTPGGRQAPGCVGWIPAPPVLGYSALNRSLSAERDVGVSLWIYPTFPPLPQTRLCRGCLSGTPALERRLPLAQRLKVFISVKDSAMSEQTGLKLPSSSLSPAERGPAGNLTHGQDCHHGDAGGDWAGLLELSPVFQLIKGVEQQLRDHAQNAGLLDGMPPGSGRPFMDFLDAQWECEGPLVRVTPGALTPRELHNYQHGRLLLQLLHARKVAPAMTLLLASSLPTNDYYCNAFRNSFYYQETESSLYVRRQRLQNVGGLSLLLLHCAAHVSAGQLGLDSAPTFRRAFFKVRRRRACGRDRLGSLESFCVSPPSALTVLQVLQVALGELLLEPTTLEGGVHATDPAPDDLVLESMPKPCREILPEAVSTGCSPTPESARNAGTRPQS
ncbi:hypothetical protein P4O66_017646 [Electrophorus voltai]|uniref:TNFR-Cys domain-containing protein n=1 Tax=Electrophorus voltai TaxID=2609070 RepID=A0AAD8YUZ6_9TELE|nr:hypothetical protein P4O66_017646 [Electrophorus voltai]